MSAVTDRNPVNFLKENILVKFGKPKNLCGHVPQVIIPQPLDRAAVPVSTSPVAALFTVRHRADLLAEVAAAMLTLDFCCKAGDVVPCDGVPDTDVRAEHLDI